MKSLILALSLAVCAAGFAPMSAEAKRFGGGSSAGMQRSLPARQAPTPPTQATPTTPAALPGAAPAAAPRRSWMGPIAGLAAGLGLAALMSHLGLGAGMGNILVLVLLALVGFALLRWAAARAGRMPSMATPNRSTAPDGPAWNPPATPTATPSHVFSPPLPPGFDVAGFERIAKMIFIRMQAANDAADLNDLRTFTTPEMYAAIKLALQERGDLPQTTDVVRVDAEVLDVASEDVRQVVSVRFHGLIREEVNGVPQAFDEIWHLVRPVDGSREWAIAGIQQAAAA